MYELETCCLSLLLSPPPAKIASIVPPKPGTTPPALYLTDSTVMHSEIGMDITTSPLLKACPVSRLRLISPPRSSRQSFVTEPPCSSNQDKSPRSSAEVLLNTCAMVPAVFAALVSLVRSEQGVQASDGRGPLKVANAASYLWFSDGTGF